MTIKNERRRRKRSIEERRCRNKRQKSRPSSICMDDFDGISIQSATTTGEPNSGFFDAIAGLRPSSSLQSIAGVLDGDNSDDSFYKEVAEKTQMYFVGRQEAEVEVFIDRLIQKEGSKDKALLYVVAEIDNESKVQMLVNTLLHRGANPSASNIELKTSLHFAVEKNYKGVCGKLLENDAWPDARDQQGRMPYTIAYDKGNDDIAPLLISYMPNDVVRCLYTSQGDNPAEFSFHTLLRKNMQKTVLSVLDCMIEPSSPSGHLKAYYQILDADEEGRGPDDDKFDPKAKSPLQIIAKSANKTIVYHDVVRLLIRRKWKDYARLRFQINSFLYLLTLIGLTFSAIVAVMGDNPLDYNSPLQIARGVFEVWCVGMALLTFLSELNQFRKHKLEYWQDAFNWIDLASSTLIIAVVPLRFTEKREQWPVYSVGFLLWTIRIFKYAAIFRQTGAYAQILWRILAHDFLQFTIVFTVILLAFSGSLTLSLRGEDALSLHNETSTFWGILFVGVRILIESERIVEYTEYSVMSCIIMVAFLFTCCVVLLNILIAQLSDTYQNVQHDAQRGLEVNRAWIVARVELNSLHIRKSQRVVHYKETEDIRNLKEVLERWETPPLSEMNNYIQEMWDNLESNKLNLLTVQNRLSRQESILINIQDQLNRLLENSPDQNTVTAEISKPETELEASLKPP